MKYLGLKKAKTLMRHHGTRLVLTYTVKGPIYCIMPGGEIEKDTADKLLESNEVQQLDDGLLSGRTQSWCIKGTNAKPSASPR